MAGTPILAPFGWLVAPLFKSISDKVYDHLGTYIVNKARDHLSTSTSTDHRIKKKRKSLEAEIPSILPHLSLVIDKAEKSPKKEKLVNWLERLKDAYYEAEEAIDLLDYEQLEQKVMNKKRIQISSPPQSKLMSCIDKLKKLEEEADEFRDLLESNENNRETLSQITTSKVFGREKDKEIIVSLLTKKPLNSEAGPSTRPAIPIIAITGRSGLGKTAIAQYVYEHMDGHDHFDIPVWVHVPRKFKATDVIKIMIENIEGKTDIPTTDEALLKHTRRMVGSKKLLLVLDDFWSDDTMDFHEQWEKFFIFLSSCSPGSKILLTTQSRNTTYQASLAGVTDVETYNLKEIEEDHFLELFMHYAWRSNSDLPKVEFEKIGRKIAVKLKGDPGAAKLVGHQLSGKLDLDHWKKVAEKDCLEDNMKARIWSYQQLPHDLQRCFAICSLFPKGFPFPRELLINIWMAEGFIRPRDDKVERLEDIGENYLDELVSWFFIEETDVEKKKRYQLHDLLHNLAERVQGDDLIRIDHSTNSRKVSSHISNMSSRSENIRHIYLPASMINKLKEKICLMKNIRTFWVKHDGGIVPINVLQEILKHMEKLRVLYLFDCVDDLPDSIGKLKHLRYLSINGYQPLKKIPDSICKLYHLQRLDLKNCESLPKDFCELISLRWFYTSREIMSHISHVGRLMSLQVLNNFIVRKECGYELHQLENLNQLRSEMRIAGLENVASTEDAIKANMQNKKHLVALKFKWNSDETDTNNATCHSTPHVELLDALQPHPCISDLTLEGFGGDRFPNWLLSQNSLNHLRSLKLVGCNKVEEISSIHESLPSCTSLILRGLKNLKKMPTFPPNLTSLEINNIHQVSYFSDDALSTCIQCLVSLSKLELSLIQTITSLPPKEVLCSLKHLKSLTIEGCYLLSSLGGIRTLTSLTELELGDCPSLNISNDSLPSSLERLNIRYCSNAYVMHALKVSGVIRALDVGNLSLLKELDLMGWDGHLEGLNSLTALRSLKLSLCPAINLSSPMDKYAFALQNVFVDDLKLLKMILSNETISSIDFLSILGNQGDSSDDEVFKSLTSLRYLYFYGYKTTHLPKSLKDLASVDYMRLVDCPTLTYPGILEDLPRNLLELYIKDCPTLTEKFKKGGPNFQVRFNEGDTIVTFPREE